MTDVATLTLKVDARQVSTAGDALNKFTAAGKTAEQAAARTAASLRETEREFRRQQQAAERAGRAMAASVLAIATAAAGTAVTFDRLLQRAAGYKDLADRIGDTAVNVAGLQLAADLSETSLNAVAAASARLSSALSKTDDESKGVGRALAAINIRVDEFKQLNPTAQLERVARELAKFEDGANKTAVATAILGRAGAELIPFLKDLAEVGGRNSRLTQQQIDDAERYTKVLSGLKSQFADLAQVIAARALPTLEKYANLTKELFGGGKSRFTLDTEIQTLQSELAKLQNLDPGFTVRGFFGTEEARAREIAKVERQLSDARKKFYAITTEAGPQNPNESRRFGMLPQSLSFDASSPPRRPRERASRAERRGEEGLPLDRVEAFRQTERLAQAQTELALTTARLAEEEEQRSSGLRQALDRQSELNGLLASTPTSQLEEARRQLDLLAEALAKTSDPAQTQKIREAMAAVAEGAGLIPKLQKDTKGARDAARDLGLAFTSAFEDAVVEGKDLQSVIASLGKDLKRIAVRKLLTEPLTANASDFFDQVLKGSGQESKESGPSTGARLGTLLTELLGGGAGGATLVAAQATQAAASTASAAALATLTTAASTAAISLQAIAAAGRASGGDALGNFIAGLSGSRAQGGQVIAGGLYRVNEQGPELLSVGSRAYLMMGPRGGRVTPNSSLANTSERPPLTVVNNFTIEGLVDRRIQMQIAAEVARTMKFAERNL